MRRAAPSASNDWLSFALFSTILIMCYKFFQNWKGMNMQMPRKTISAFELEDFHRNVPDDELIADLVRTSQQLGKNKITFREYNVNGKYASSTISVGFVSWLNALKNAGLEKMKNWNVSNEDLFRNVVAVWSKLGASRNSGTPRRRHPNTALQPMLTDLAAGGARCGNLSLGQSMKE
jgi:Homing endonuclease associated repeat